MGRNLRVNSLLQLTVVLFVSLCVVSAVSSRSAHSHHHKRLHNSHKRHLDDGDQAKEKQKLLEDDADDDTSSDIDDQGRHSYLMVRKKEDRNALEAMDEDKVLTAAFERHMEPPDSDLIHKHDVYAYKLPSDLWFIVKYHKDEEGNIEKYMNIIDSLTNYLDKLDSDVKSINVNVKGVETVFKITNKE